MSLFFRVAAAIVQVFQTAAAAIALTQDSSIPSATAITTIISAVVAVSVVAAVPALDATVSAPA